MSSGRMFGKSASKMCPMLPPSQTVRPLAATMSASIVAVVDLPTVPVTPTTAAGQAFKNNSVSEVICAPLCCAASTKPFAGRTAGFTTTASAV